MADIKVSIKNAMINEKVNACPMAVRLAWHASGTFSTSPGSEPAGGSDGATMRFDPEKGDGANAGLGTMRSLLTAAKDAHPDVSDADLWTLAGALAVEYAGGPKIPHGFGRTDAADASNVPPNGRLPDATQGAQHLRDVFYRMGFNDREIVALSGAHTLGRCHLNRSGFDGKWTANPLKFDNSYFTGLVEKKWTKREWDGPPQWQDESGELMMLATDLCLLEDPAFAPVVKEYAASEETFFNDFSAAFAKLLNNGCSDSTKAADTSAKVDAVAAGEAGSGPNHEFREACMHGHASAMALFEKCTDINEGDATGRTALHKAAFWGHANLVEFIIAKGGDLNVKDYNDDTPLHDCSRFGHQACVDLLTKAGADASAKNKAGQTPAEGARVC